MPPPSPTYFRLGYVPVDPCPTAHDKVHVLSEAAMLAKEQLVSEWGIGEELPMTFTGWVEDQMVVTCLIPRSASVGVRYIKASETLGLMRRAWGTTAISLTHDGFHSDPPLPVDHAAEFAAGNPLVQQALIVLHAQPEGVGFKAIPYTYGLGRKVTFGSPVLQMVNLRNCGPYPAAMWNALREEFIFGIRPRTIKRLTKIGVEVHEFL